MWFDKTRQQVTTKVTRPIQVNAIVAFTALAFAIVALFVAVAK